MEKSLMILTSGFGDGHNAAAKGLERASCQIQPNAPVSVHDLLLETNPKFGAFLQRRYIGLITSFPGVWKWAYARMDKSGPMAQKTALFSGLTRRLGELIEQKKPSALISTYPLYPVLVERLQRQGVKTPPIFTVITDSLTVNGMWLAGHSDLYFTADDFTADIVAGMGVPKDRVRGVGFAVDPAYVKIAQEPAPAENTPRILFFSHGSASRVAGELDSLLPLLRRGVQLHIGLGRNASRLHHTVTRFTDRHPDLPVLVSGWLSDVPAQMGSHHVLISKAGGATTHEAISAAIPLIVDGIIPGQEEGNAELLTRLGGGVVAKKPEDVGAAAEKILASGLAEWQKMKANLQKSRKPDGALQVIRQVLEH